jgi:hypothetical protein
MHAMAVARRHRRSERVRNIATYGLASVLIALLVWLYWYSPWSLRHVAGHLAPYKPATWECVGACPGGHDNSSSGAGLFLGGGLLTALIFVGFILMLFAREQASVRRRWVIGLGVTLLLCAAAYFWMFTTNEL